MSLFSVNWYNWEIPCGASANTYSELLSHFWFVAERIKGALMMAMYDEMQTLEDSSGQCDPFCSGILAGGLYLCQRFASWKETMLAEFHLGRFGRYLLASGCKVRL